MKIIDFNSTKCRHCYKCVRNCEIKAISVLGGRAEIMEDSCILCGRCLAVCPQEAKTLMSELDEVRAMIRRGEKVAAQLAPAYLGLMKFREPGQLRAALRRLGFVDVFETAEGAAVVTDAYRKLIEAGTMDNIITTCCPAVNDLIEMYYPSMVPYLAPVVSPMIAEGRIMKHLLGRDTKVVFIGPCIAKKKEARDPRHADAVDAVISFHDLEVWLQEEGISVSDCPSEPFAVDPAVNRLYPVTGGVLTSLQTTEQAEGLGKEGYRRFYVRGVHSCIELCTDLSKGTVHNCLIEMNMCEGGCIKGPTVTDMGVYKYKIKLDMEDTVPRKAADSALLRRRTAGVSFEKRFEDRSVPEPFPTEEEIRRILAKTGKRSPADELNCSACGYPSCREKAIAVYQGKAELGMCIPYLTAQAESMSNLVLRESPNAIIIADAQLRIREYSPVGEKYFGISREDALQRPLSDLIDPRDCDTVRRTRRNIYGKKVYYQKYDLWTLQNIVYIPRQDSTLMMIIDITDQEKRELREQETRNATAEMAQNVIRNQMITAQKIASLLGETTAETKITLTRLMSAMQGEGEGDSEGEDQSASEGSPVADMDDSARSASVAEPAGLNSPASRPSDDAPSSRPDPFLPLLDGEIVMASAPRKLKVNTRYAKPKTTSASGTASSTNDASLSAAGSQPGVREGDPVKVP